MGATLKDIADKAKVSPATVSLALNSKPGVSDSTRERVLRIAEDLGYGFAKRDPVTPITKNSVRFLKIATHGHTVNRDHDVFIADYIDGLTHGADRQSFNLEISSFRALSPQEIIASISPIAAAGVVILGTELSTDDILTFSQLTVPVVFLDTYHDFLNVDFVDMNNIDAVHKVITYLIQNGHEEIGFVRSGVNTHNFQLRDEGFQKVVRDLEIPVRESHIFTVDSTYQGAYQDMHRYLGRGIKMPTSLFCTNDVIAYGCIKALREKGYRIPDEVSVVGFDDLPLSSVMDPPLTTIRVSKRLMGELAVERISSQIAAASRLPPVKIQVGAELIIRHSVKSLKVSRIES